jgi:hypothetical protein
MAHDLPDTPHDIPVDDDLDPAIAAALWRTYSEDVDVDTAARHLWRIHRAANPAAPANPRRARRALVGVLTGLMLLMSAGGALAASVDTVPGDPLYSLKRGVERTRLVLALSPDTDARLHLAMARQRLAEADTAAVRRPSVVPQLLEEAATSIESAERSGSPTMVLEAAVVREEASQKTVALALVLEDDDGKAQMIAFGERFKPVDGVEIDAAPPAPPPDRVMSTLDDDRELAVEPLVETSVAETGSVETGPPTPVSTPTSSPSPRPSPSPSPTPSPDPDEDTEEEDGEFETGLPPAESKDGLGAGKEPQEIRPDSEDPNSEDADSQDADSQDADSG